MTPQESYNRFRKRDRAIRLQSHVLLCCCLFMTGVAIYAWSQFEAEKEAALGWRSNYSAATNILNSVMTMKGIK